MSLVYKDLDESSRRHIWTQFLARSPNAQPFTEDQLDRLAAVVLNGRQIKNLLRTASLLAWSQKKSLAFEHVNTVLSLKEGKSL